MNRPRRLLRAAGAPIVDTGDSSGNSGNGGRSGDVQADPTTSSHASSGDAGATNTTTSHPTGSTGHASAMSNPLAGSGLAGSVSGLFGAL